MNLKQLTEFNIELLENEIRDKKTDLINSMDSMERMLEFQRQALAASLNNSTSYARLNPVGILQRQGQMIETMCAEIATKCKHLVTLKRMLEESHD